MSNTEKRKYIVLKPIAWGGRREVGEILELTAEEAANLGDEYVALESEPVTTGESSPEAGAKVEDEADVNPKRSRKAKK
ncbi:MAG: hypothetical protein KatS3mg101_1074 [Patescibacteria group bacterium]|nr:MAG: hypothetical protein KatS3mg101_1074 [Patescibacteria group bacterium]